MRAVGKYIVIEPIKEIDVQTKGGLILAEKQREDVRYRRAKVLEPGSDVLVLKKMTKFIMTRQLDLILK